MDPLTALSLASNVIQLIDFSSRIVSNCRGIYKSVDGALPEHQELELVTEDVLRLSKKLRNQRSEKPGTFGLEPGKSRREFSDEHSRTLEQEIAHKALSDMCISVSEELLLRLAKHKFTGGSSGQRKWKSFREALETVWSKKDLDALASRLDQLKTEISLHILVTLKERFDLESIQNARRFEWLDKNTKFLVKELSQSRDAIERNLDMETAEEQHVKTREIVINALQRYMQDEAKRPRPIEKMKNFDMLKEGELKESDHVHEKMEFEDQIHSTDEEKFNERQKISAQKISDAKIDMEKQRIKYEIEFRRSILTSLSFDTMESRYLDIKDAHERTFDWIHEGEFADQTPWSNFEEWLTKGSGIYWINGKAGSGKSTLMHYIFKHSKTRKMLAKWSGDGSEVLTPGFFFWSGGSLDQSSQLGLLRSVLYTILTGNQNLVPVAVPARYENFPNSLIENEDFQQILCVERYHRWTLTELKQAFQRLLKEDFGYMCLFIDGLDEYYGDPMDTITWFKSTISRKIKICISSRPWVVFEEAFSYCPQLKLQDLTTEDIRIYINDTLCSNNKMKNLFISEPTAAPELVQGIISKASGVFLWVRLVVTSLLRGLNNNDQIKDLQRRLDLLPAELQALFSYMLTLVEPVYIREGSQILQIMLKYQQISAVLQKDYPQVEGLSGIELSFAIDSDDSYLFQSPVNLMPDSEVGDRIADIDCRLKVRCAGLLEIPSYWQRDSCPHKGRMFSSKIGRARVQWLHRTVKDFLESDGGREMLRKNTLNSFGVNFNPSRPLLIASILHLKRWFLNMDVINGVHPLPGLVARSMATAYQAERESGQPETEILEELDGVVQQLSPMSPKRHWVEHLYHDGGMINFISLAEKHCLKYFLCAKLLASEDKPSELNLSSKDSYLGYLDWSKPAHLASHEQSLSYMSKNKRLLSIMLKIGCDPNRSCHEDKSGWHIFLRALVQQTPVQEQGAAWCSIAQLFLEYRADPSSKLVLDGHMYSPRDIISEAFSRNYPLLCDALMATMPIPQQKQPHRRAKTWLVRKIFRGSTNVT
ncbi:hypothetical protein WAI453_013487 [Rhynchosporium graminicola]